MTDKPLHDQLAEIGASKPEAWETPARVTIERETLQAAIDALRYARTNFSGPLYASQMVDLRCHEVEVALRAALAAQPVEPDMRHPKIQALLGSRARCQIEIQLVEELIEDPNFETTSLDMEHWGPMHDKLKEKLTAPPAPAAQQPTAALVPLTDAALVAAYCETLGIHQFVQAFVAGARYAERAHGIGDKP